jgi:hypothetical protein
MKRVVFLGLKIMLCLLSIAQKNQDLNQLDAIFSKDHLAFTGKGLIIEKGRVNGEKQTRKML